MEILLTYKAHGKGGRDPYTALLPVGLGTLNAFLRKEGYPSRIANLSGYSWQDIGRLLACERPALLGVSQFTHNRFESLRLARMAKDVNPDCFVVFGGPHASHRFNELLSQNHVVDAVVLGEGEETFCELAACLMHRGGRDMHEVRGIAFRSGGAVVTTLPRPPLADLDTVPFAAPCLGDAPGVDAHRQLEFIITSRGCPASCRFCSSPRFWGRGLRFRSPRSVVDEIRDTRDRFGLIYFSIRDDTFTADRQRVLEFCRLLLKEKVYILWNCQSRVNAVDEETLFWMKRAGCECIQFGVESGAPRILKALGKGITPEQVKSAALAVRRAGIQLSVYLITGVPGEGPEDLKQTLALLDVIKAHDGQVSPLAYYPGTRLFEDGAGAGLVAADLFEADRREALLVRTDPFVAQATEALLAKLDSVAGRSGFSPRDFLAQKRALGYCHATNVMAGEMYEAAEEWRKAESEYREITVTEPDNPWGWLMLGELCAKRGRISRARQAFESLARCVPAHAPAYAYMGEMSRLAGDYRDALKQYRQALALDPLEKTAQSGVKLVTRQTKGETR